MISYLLIHTIYLVTSVNANIDMNRYDCIPEWPNSNNEGYQSTDLFATKTSYLLARQENRLAHFDIANWYHALIAEEAKTCKPIYHYFLSRHTIRFPKKKNIIRYVNEAPQIARNLLEAGRLANEQQNDFSRWRPMFSEIDDNHVTPTGKLEMGITAEIFYSYFPSLYDIDNLNITVSRRIRTRESALAFIRPLVNLKLQREQQRTSASSPTKYTEEWNEAVEAEIKRIDKSITESDLLMLNVRCKKWMRAQGVHEGSKPRRYNELFGSTPYRRMADQFNERNGLQNATKIDTTMMLELSKLCNYETAYNGFSPWCDILLYSERVALNFLNDVEMYVDAYGQYQNRKIGCLLIVDLHRKLSAVMQNPNVRHRTTIYFGHDNLLSRLYSFLQLFQLFPPFEYIGRRFPRVCIPRYREWISGMLFPFGANFAVTILKCDYRYPKNLKMLVLINEVPISIPGCPTGYCNLITFLDYHKDLEKDCDIDKICPLTQ